MQVEGINFENYTLITNFYGMLPFGGVIMQKIFLAHVLVNQCFPQRLIADFHSLFHLSGLGTAGAAPALWPFNHYTALIDKTQCTLAILLQKLRHTQRICLYINLGTYQNLRNAEL